MNLDAQYETLWHSLKRAKPKSEQAAKLRDRLKTIQLKRLRRDIKAKGKAK